MSTPIGSSREIRSITLNDFSRCQTLHEKISLALKFANLAPSTHNIQPWKIRQDGLMCEILVDTSVQLPYTDPTRRCSYISVGCFLENLLLAAHTAGIVDRVENGKDAVVARVYFKDGAVVAATATPRKLAGAITKRRNVRGPFSAPSLPPEQLQELKTLVGSNDSVTLSWITERQQVARLAELTAEGMRNAHAQKAFRKELSGWIVSNYSKRDSGIPGFSMNMPNPLSLLVPIMIGLFNMGPVLSKLNFMSVSSAPLVCVFSGPDDPRTWTAVGHAAERVMLAAAALGMTSSVYVASIEMGELYKEVQKVTGTPERPQFLLCVGPMEKYPTWFTQRKTIV